MKWCSIFAIASMLLAPAVANGNEWSDYNQIKKASAPFVVNAFNPALVGLKDIYAAVSDEYGKAATEFERKKLESKYETETKTYIREIRTQNRFYVSVPINLAEYDFEKKGFKVARPLYIKPRPSIKDDGTAFSYPQTKVIGIYVDIDNFKTGIFLPMSLEAAEKLSVALAKSRAADLVVYGRVTGAQENKGFLDHSIHIHMNAIAASVKLETGEEVGFHRF